MRYRAFISYSSADRKIGEQFQREIEYYKIPRALRGSDRGFGPTPTRLTPLFRDRSDANAGHSLADTLKEALSESEALVVLCSPVSAQSKWVNEEILAFKALGRDARIFPVLIDGAPRRYDAASTPDGAFPPALFSRVDASGAVLGQDGPEPLAPDVRVTGDGMHFARLKIVAALTGIPLTELTERQLAAERRERFIVRAVAASMTALAVVASVAAVLAVRESDTARRRLASAIEIAARRVDNAARYRDEYGVPTPVVRQLLSGAEHDFSELIDDGTARSPTLELQRGRLYALFSSLYAAVGDGERQMELADRAVSTLYRVPTARDWRTPATWLSPLPRTKDLTAEKLGALEAKAAALTATDAGIDQAAEILQRGRTLAHASGDPLYEARFFSLEGERAYLAGNLQGALNAHNAAQRILQDVIKQGGPDVHDASLDLAHAQSDAAEILLELAQHDEALAEQSVAQLTFETEAARAPQDAAAQRALAESLTRTADMRYAVSGDWTKSIPEFERAVSIFRAVAASDPARIDYARNLSIGLERLGDARLQMGQFTAARPLYDQALELCHAILARDPSNPEAQRDLAVALERQADISMALKDSAGSLELLDEARALRALSVATASADGDILQSHDLAILWGKTGDARVAAKRPASEWREAYDTAISTITPLVTIEGAPPGWMRDLAVFHASYADALARMGQPNAARTHYRTALTWIKQQRALDPDDPRLRADDAVLRGRLKALQTAQSE